jgi:hypothetical protein
MLSLKLFGLLLLLVLVSSNNERYDLYRYDKTLCQSVCDSLTVDNDTGLSDKQMAVDMFYATGNSKNVIEFIDAMGNYTLPLKKKFLNTWLTMKVLKSYTSQVSLKFNQSFTKLLQNTSPGKTEFCQPCDVKNLISEIKRVNANYGMLDNEKIGNNLQLEVRNKPLIGSPDTSYVLRMERDSSASSSSSGSSSSGTGGTDVLESV